MQRLISWLLALLTALMNNLGFWQQPEKPYIGDPGYAIQEDAVNYSAMREWYNASFEIAGSVCTLEPEMHSQEKNRVGVGYIVADTPMNPDAKMEFGDENIIIAPQNCKVTTQPSSSPNKIVVSNSESGVNAFRMEITNPKRWFCCEKLQPNAAGNFKHKQDDHRINLKAGQTICVASDKTEVKLFRGDSDGKLSECNLREFLRSFDSETGDPNQVVGGGTEATKTSESKTDVVNNLVDIKSDKLFKGPAMWHEDSTGWWYGQSTAGNSRAGIDWASDQWVIYEGYYYYFDSSGYMVKGWYDDYYYKESGDKYEAGLSDFKYGALCFNTIVPADGEAGYFEYVGLDGTVATDDRVQQKGKDVHEEAEGVAYVYDDSAGKYKLYDPEDGVIGSGETGGSGNNNPTSNIVTRKAEVSREDIDEGETIVDSNGNSFTGWASCEGSWYYVRGGQVVREQTTQRDETFYLDGARVYLIDVDNEATGPQIPVLQSFIDDTGKLIIGQSSGSAPVYISYQGSHGTYWLVVDQNGYVVLDKWWQDGQGRWLRANNKGTLYGAYGVGEEYTIVEADGNGWQYAFDTNCYCDTTTEYITVNGNTYRLASAENTDPNNPPPDGARRAYH